MKEINMKNPEKKEMKEKKMSRRENKQIHVCSYIEGGKMEEGPVEEGRYWREGKRKGKENTCQKKKNYERERKIRQEIERKIYPSVE